MKIAVASDKGMAAMHFGHCETFEIFEVLDGNVTRHEIVENPGHRPGYLPNFLNELGVSAVIAGGMGLGAVEIFKEHGIDAVAGVQGQSLDLALRYARGELDKDGSFCDHDEEKNSPYSV
ncbi:MAG: NifB/NifX family molybdenum-iron cluster-binding protein [Clostridia bacterium]